MKDEQDLSVSVGKLIEFSCKTGDLFFTAPAGPSAQEGIRAHKKLQQQIPKESEAEFSLKVTLPELISGYRVTIQGRVDILHPAQDLLSVPLLEEIKTTYVHPDKIPDSQKQLQWAQLKLYGYAYGLHQLEQGDTLPSEVDLQAVWYNIKDKQVFREKSTCGREALETFAREAIERYCAWQRSVHEQLQQTRADSQALAFPFPHYRAGQREMAVSVYRCLRDAQMLMLEAPTGIGKTMSSLYPSLKALGEGLVDKVVYLTAKNSGREAVLDAVEKMQASELKLSVLVLKARKLSCACRNGACERDLDGACPFTKGFYDRLPEAREALIKGPLMTPERLAEVGQAYRLCPFELSISMLPWATLVVCDFNYVFDPLVGLSYFDDNSDRIALLVDEAHNLGDRSRDMYSALADRSMTQRAAKECKTHYPLIHKAAKGGVRALDRWSKDCGLGVSVHEVFNAEGERNEETGDAVTRAQARVIEAVSLSLEQGGSLPDSVNDWLREVYRYLAIDALLTEEHRVITTVDERKTPKGTFHEQAIALRCLNASAYLEKIYNKFHSTVLFSASLRPPEYFQSRLGLPAGIQNHVLPSPFEPSQLGVFVCSHIDTRYQYRDRSVGDIVDIVFATYRAKAGNYLVFFPSYRFMNQVAEAFQERHQDVAIIQQASASSDEQRAEFLQAFEGAKNTLGFAIMGGIFGEGVDYVGDKLIGAIVVGVGLPQINEEQDLIKASSEASGHNGFDYAYRYPGLIRVLQAAGRVIRTEQDRGVLVLVDSRFSQVFYRRLWPSHWQAQTVRDVQGLSEGFNHFW